MTVPHTLLSRRALLASAGAAVVAGRLRPAVVHAEIDPVGGPRRRAQAFQLRVQAAQAQRQLSLPDHPDNGDEARYPNLLASYSKGLPHDANGEVDRFSYAALTSALTSGRPADFEAIPMGCPGERRLVNPQAGLAFEIEGADSHHLAIPPAPPFAGAEQAAELVELYWQAVLRDVPFTQYDSHPLVQQAAADLSRLSGFRGPRLGNQVTPATLFRGFAPGDLNGPYLSQFLLRPVPMGANGFDQRMRSLQPGHDYITQYPTWLDIQNGCLPREPTLFDGMLRYIHTGRDLAQWAHIDVLYQGYFHAMLILLTPPDPSDPIAGGGIGAPLNPGNPYLESQTQDPFGTFGGPAIATELPEVATRALKAVWFQKWFVHRRLRPEAFAGRVHNRLTRGLPYPIHVDVLNSAALSQINSRFGTFLLPQAYPEGSPLHPSYGAGHATVAGACVTILKALFDELFVIPDPVVPTPDGLALVPYSGPPLTVGSELNKLAANVAMGRNWAGIHWRSDYTESLRLGEAVAISVLRDHALLYNEPFSGFTLTTFDGATVTV